MNTFFTKERAEWRQWLTEHSQTEGEIWVVFPTSKANEKGLSYNDAVEEALCFGWIDGRAGKLDDTHEIRRFTPRRPGSSFSRSNIERLLWLDERGLLLPSVREEVLPLLREPFVFPDDILAALRKDPVTWENFCRFSEPYKRIRVAYIDAARKEADEFGKRLANFLEKTRENKLIRGYGGIEKYYR